MRRAILSASASESATVTGFPFLCWSGLPNVLHFGCTDGHDNIGVAQRPQCATGQTEIECKLLLSEGGIEGEGNDAECKYCCHYKEHEEA
jgi:hypothetical protein